MFSSATCVPFQRPFDNNFLTLALSLLLPSSLSPSHTTATCLGFGCGSYQNVEFPGAEKPTNEPSISFPAFLKAIDEKKIEKVELLKGGNIAYATLKGEGAEGSSGSGSDATAAAASQRIRVGEGYPIDASKAWSSPLW